MIQITLLSRVVSETETFIKIKRIEREIFKNFYNYVAVKEMSTRIKGRLPHTFQSIF